MKINTINVVETVENTVTHIHTFMEITAEKEAMETMAKCIREDNPNIKDEDVESCVEDGEYQNETYTVSIIRSVTT